MASLFGAEVLGTQAEFLAASGDLDAALTVAEAWADRTSTRYFYGHRGRGTFLVRHAVAAGRHDLADAVTAELEEGARRCPAASAAAAALLCRGLVHRDRTCSSTPWRIPRDPTPSRLAAGLRRRRRAARRRRSARRGDRPAPRSRAIHDEIDAAADAGRVEATLRDLGTRGTRRRAAARLRMGITDAHGALGRQLVAEGLTNPEIGARLLHLSPHRRNAPLPRVQEARTREPHPLAAEVTRRATTPE